MAEEKKEPVRLKSTDTLNVAQVMYLIREYHEYNRIPRRIVRFFRHLFRSTAVRHQAADAIAKVDKASRTKKAINAAGHVVDIPVE